MATGRGDVVEHGRVADNVERPLSNFYFRGREKKANGPGPRSEI